MGKALFQITPLGCPGCGKQIEAELLKQSGVSSAKVFPSLGRIIMEFDEIKASAEDLESMMPMVSCPCKTLDMIFSCPFLKEG